METSTNTLSTLSADLVRAVELAGKSILKIEDGSRLSASGSVWSDDGIVVATSHGVEADEGLIAHTHDGAKIPIELLGRDHESDLAVLKLASAGPTGFKRAPAAPSVGTLVLALGRPGSAGLQATFGIIGSISREGTVYHSDATLYPGFSGGALVDSEGQFLGLLNLGFGRGRGGAISASTVETVVDSVLKHGSVQRGYLGVGTQAVGLSAALQQKLGRAQSAGLLIVSIEPETAADKGGLLIGDTIVEIDAVPVGEPRQLRHALGNRRPGDNVTLQVMRGGVSTSVQVVLGGRN